MKKNFKSIKELTDYLNEKLVKAMDGVGEKALKHMKNYVKKEFEKTQPKVYERTYEYLESIDRFEAWIHSDGSIRTEIYYNADLINPYLASEDFGRGTEYASGQNWNWHMSFEKESVSEFIPLWLDYGTSNPYYSHKGIGGIIDLRKWVQDNFRRQLQIELRKQGIQTK